MDMFICALFFAHHPRQGYRVLVHCVQGRDRSAAIVMAFVAIFCPTSYPLRLRSDFDALSFDRPTDAMVFVDYDDDNDNDDDNCLYSSPDSVDL